MAMLNSNEIMSNLRFIEHAKRHAFDWLMIVVLILVEVVLQFIPPHERYVGRTDLYDLSYPLQKNTIPTATVPIFALVIPLTAIVVVWLIKKDRHDFHHAILGVLTAVLLTAILTDSIKVAVGRLRPDFFYRCFPNGLSPGTLPDDSFKENGDALCNGKASVIKEGRKSFPSGHSSWTFAGLTYLSLYLAGKLHVLNGHGKLWKLVPAVTPLWIASLVAISRVNDYWHHWQDVTVGGLLGFFVAICVYFQHYPWLTEGGDPRPVMTSARSGGKGAPGILESDPEDGRSSRETAHGFALLKKSTELDNEIAANGGSSHLVEQDGRKLGGVQMATGRLA